MATSVKTPLWSHFSTSKMEDFMTLYTVNAHIFKEKKSNIVAVAKEGDGVTEND